MSHQRTVFLTTNPIMNHDSKRCSRTLVANALFAVISLSLPVAAAESSNEAWRSVDLRDEQLVITGARFASRTKDEIRFDRFSPETLAKSKRELNFNARKARTTTGVMLHFVTDSPKILLQFKHQQGENRGSEFGVFQDGKLIQEEQFFKKLETFELSITSVTPGQRAQFAISFPSLSNPALTGFHIDKTAEMFAPDIPQRVYVALGDSISHGVGQGSASHKTWPFRLAQRLDASLYNLAVGGGKISVPAAETLSQLERVDLVTILVGYNDWNSGVEPAEFAQTYGQALAALRKSHPQARIVCITPTFTTRTESKRSDFTIDEFREAIRKAVGTHQHEENPIQLVEGLEITSQENLRTDHDDPVHFSEEGARQFAKAMDDRLQDEVTDRRSTAPNSVAPNSTKPNIILFFVDDFGQRDLSCYGSELYETPHRDRLAEEGMRFTRAYSAYPRCVPSRQGLLSGKYPARVVSEAIAAGTHKHHLPLSEVTFGEALQEHGYHTCYIGKWHLGKDGGDPGAQGFETVIHAGSAGATGSYFYPFPVEKGNKVVNPIEGSKDGYLTDLLTDEAVKYVESASAETPFLMVMAHYAVHTPFEAPEEVTRKYRKQLRDAGVPIGGKKDDPDFITDRQGIVKTVQNNPIYAAMVERTDDSLGRIVQAVNDSGIADNTIIILTSDHGGLSTRGLENGRALATSNAPLRQGKGSIFEGGTRVPLVVKWPDHIEPGSVSNVQVTGTDHYPTMLRMAGADLMPAQHVDGRSYLNALQGETSERDGMFWYKWQARPDSTGDTRALSYIQGDYKVIQWIDEDLVELFDLSKDISEQTNLAAEMPDRTQAMLAKLHQVEQEVGDLRERGRKDLERRLERPAVKNQRRKKANN